MWDIYIFMKYQFNSTILLCVFWFSGFCIASQQITTLTVWVHGTNPPPNIFWNGQYSPFRPWLYASPGLSLAKELPKNYYFHKLAKKCALIDELEFPFDTFYTYGWPSTMPSVATRKHEGRKLFDQLNNLIKEFAKIGQLLKVRLVGFSHGGNVILNMISYLPFSCQNIDIEVVFLGIPVQELTRKNINSPWVHRAFSFYTDADWLQVMDVQALQNWKQGVPWFSQKTFYDEDQVIQIKLMVDGKSIGHREYRLINHHVPSILRMSQAMTDGKKSGHCELNFLTHGYHG